MKTIKLSIVLLFLALRIALAQDTIFVSYSKTTAIQFPAEVKELNSTSPNILAQVKGDNTIAVRANGKQIRSTKLNVETVDGKTYDLPVAFSYGRSGKLVKYSAPAETTIPIHKVTTIEAISERLFKEGRLHSVSRDKANKIVSKVGNISVFGDQLFYKLAVNNRSNIPYDIDFIRFYVRDLKTAKRTVTQEQEITPAYSYATDKSRIEGQQSQTYIYAFNKFPISNGKALYIEVYEKNGDRHQYLKVKRSDIEKAPAIR